MSSTKNASTTMDADMNAAANATMSATKNASMGATVNANATMDADMNAAANATMSATMNATTNATMNANPILLQKKYARVVALFAEHNGITLEKALDIFYHSVLYDLMSEGVSDMHCMSDEYLAQELKNELKGELNASHV